MKGFTLIELSIALLLSSILVLGSMQVLLIADTMAQRRHNLDLNQMQARYIDRQLRNYFSQTGYTDCRAGDLSNRNGQPGYSRAAIQSADRSVRVPAIRAYGGYGIWGGFQGLTLLHYIPTDEKDQDAIRDQKTCNGEAVKMRAVTVANCFDSRNGQRNLCLNISDGVTIHPMFYLPAESLKVLAADTQIEEVGFWLARPDKKMLEITWNPDKEYLTKQIEADVFVQVLAVRIRLRINTGHGSSLVSKNYEGLYALRNAPEARRVRVLPDKLRVIQTNWRLAD